MTKKVRAVFDGKVLCPEEPVELVVNGRYMLNIQPLEEEKQIDNVDPDPAYDISEMAVKTGISDLASEHDHYLYGTPKRRIE